MKNARFTHAIIIATNFINLNNLFHHNKVLGMLNNN